MENENFDKKENGDREAGEKSRPAQREKPPARRGKMERKQRAKQFIPFSALKGLEEALTVEELKREK